ncbi:MAG: restriction endonuclease [Eubacteriales bacterium]|nr:restriction endonuclease [Eubacteriales bacterium]
MEEKNYWLHRISHHAEVSHPLLEKGYLTIGFSDLLRIDNFIELMKAKDWEFFEEANMKVWNSKGRARYSLWRFIKEFKVNDWVLVPSWSTFSVYRITSDVQVISSLNNLNLKDWNGIDIKLIDGYLYRDDVKIDLGFYIQVELIEKDISRDKYAQDALISRMKVRQTNVCISDLKVDIEKTVTAYKEKKTVELYSSIIDSLADSLLSSLQKLTPDRFEKLIKWYFEKMGAYPVDIPHKNESGKEEGADADIKAIFKSLKLIFYIQAKKHRGETSQWAVEQISRYKDQKEVIDDDYTYATWVVSTGDSYTTEAHELAKKTNVRLIDGLEFAKMLIDAGLTEIDRAFIT